MGRMKPTAQDDENLPAVSRKSKKKALLIEDNEYSIGTELSEEPQEEKVVITGKKKGKKGNTKVLLNKVDGNDVEEVDNEDDVPEVVFSGKKKSKSMKGGSNSMLSASGFGLLDEGNDDDVEEEEEQSGATGWEQIDEEDQPVVNFTSKKKGSKKGNESRSLFTRSAFDAIDDSKGEMVDSCGQESKDDNDDHDVPVIAFTGKKKSSRGGKKGVSLHLALAFDELDEGGEIEDGKEDVEDVAPITFSGKKKKSSKKGVNSLSASLLDEENDEEASISDFSKSGNNSVGDEDASVVPFSGKKKPSKTKNNGAIATLSNEAELGSEVIGGVESEQPRDRTSNAKANDSKVTKSEEVAEPSKNKKKKKKSGRTAQEEDDLDKILAELGEAPSISTLSALPAQDEKFLLQHESATDAYVGGEKEVEEETVESAAAKKKKKKKEKEKEKKVAAASAAATAGEVKVGKLEETKTETTEPKKIEAKSKAVDKKVPKHVREMQEALARRKEAEERKKREEEERLRKEEEERHRQEELERQAEEARRRKKDREKEKLLKKKQEGKLLTGKQKEEARRLEARRNQILADAGISLPSDKDVAPAKRPKYQTKKSKAAHQQSNGAASVKAEENVEAKEKHLEQQELAEVDYVESEKAEEAESVDMEENLEAADVAKENIVEEEEDEDEWDAKSWDDVTLNVKGAFDDEEADSETEHVVKKGAAPASRSAATAVKKAIPLQPVKSHDVENKKSQATSEVDEKNSRKDAAPKSRARSSDSHPEQSEDNLRSPICCIMGHVDTGKTKLLDCIRGTNVQEGEAGGITQQIGATYFPAERIRERTKELKADAKLKVPGLLVIDTPGHESFSNLRSRGSGLCDIAILVVDMMHGLEPQTIESLNLLKMRNTKFIVALNKVDRLYGWKTCHNAPIVKAMKQQTKDVQNEFNMRLTQIITQFKEQGLNTELYYKNKEMEETFSIVPTSAISGEGIPDLLLLLVQWSQKTMVEKLTFINEVQCTVLEVKLIEGHGMTIDVVLVNGVLHSGDQIVVCGLQGPIVTTIRALLTPHPMKELRIKGSYLSFEEVKAAQGIKIAAQGLEHAIAGTGLYVVGPDDDLEDIKEAAMADMNSVMSRIDKSGEGVCVQASTLGSLEALLEFLKTPEVSIPVSCISIGPVHKKDVMKASVMLEKKKEYATILAFDVKVTPEVRELADELGVKIFMADIIYHLFDQFKAYINNLKEEKKREAADEVVFPCVLKILPNCIFNKKDPIVLGVDVVEGIAKVGTPICIPQKDFIDIGRIASIEDNHKPADSAKKGKKVAIKIVGSSSEEQQKMYGRHFELDDELVSRISRNSIDVLKANYRDDLSLEEWKLVVKLKTLFRIQ
ncbi:GTP_EFTU domain-containing protein/GTP_EFTU_D2 domain-containing protein/IF-2 domain-containing protein [Cephalotus follicularis]|uniref:Eukaryotic translation initiation factor 5B n=1 Tax=Cephalotus follicularis TaxID=3775 RepID=A0A1Q3DIA4_CEPFO|nr:GTP_EFTU domain-containing protein/GTP_EFTU_D2 domain-containing protein/IF-2 domain-containing protein [Cephalotus follicularis]